MIICCCGAGSGVGVTTTSTCFSTSTIWVSTTLTSSLTTCVTTFSTIFSFSITCGVGSCARGEKHREDHNDADEHGCAFHGKSSSTECTLDRPVHHRRASHSVRRDRIACETPMKGCGLITPFQQLAFGSESERWPESSVRQRRIATGTPALRRKSAGTFTMFGNRRRFDSNPTNMEERMHVRRGNGLMPGQPVDVSTPPWDMRTGDESREWSSDRRPISHTTMSRALKATPRETSIVPKTTEEYCTPMYLCCQTCKKVGPGRNHVAAGEASRQLTLAPTAAKPTFQGDTV